MRRSKTPKAFALPTVLIASIVLLTILAVSVTATAAIRTTLKNQYYIQLAQVAGESGVAYAKACLAANGNIPQWTDAKPLTPATDCSGNLTLSPSVKALLVAGGGSGGGSTGGGGGAGGMLYNSTIGISATAYSVIIGAGGAIPGTMGHGLSGGNSSFNGLVAIGGGGGGYSANSTSGAGGYNGGSGGGGQNYYGSYAPGTGTVGQGNNGAPGGSASAGGGGGAGGAGTTSPTANIGGNGGPGVQNNITGSMIYYAAGGGGGDGGVAGTGGNQTPGPGNGQAPSASANTGNGGTGGWAYADGNGGAGGSGIVVISFPVDSGITATGGTVTNSGGNEIHKFTSSGTFTVTSTGNASCPSDPSCSVTVNGNVRSSFKVPKPIVDPATGQALTIPNSGYVEVTRTSNGAVWRTYQQPSVQAAVVPDLCSGNATAARGWSSAVTTTQQDSLPSASTAKTISLADGPLSAGTVYYRKDFNADQTAAYDLNVYTSSAQDIATTYMDGIPQSTARGSLATTKVSLTAGCHVMVTKVVNDTFLPRPSDFTASLTISGNAAPVVVTDATWRVTAGDAAHYSMNNYDETPGAWQQVLDMGVWNNPTLPWGGAPANWSSVSGDSLAQYITTQYSTGGLNRPGDSYAWFRDPQSFTTVTATTIRLSSYCDDQCNVYLDGVLVFSPPSGSGLNSKSIGLQPGKHTFGVRLYNAPTGNIGAFIFSAVDLTTNQVLDRSSPNWDSTTSWSSSHLEPYSFDVTYQPTPAVQPSVNAKVLVVGGGGGGGSDMGGGGGGGGVVYNAAYPLSPGTYNVVVGPGGSGAPAGIGQARGSNGSNSTFGRIRALGGGGGGSEYSTNTSPPGAGASSGGSAGCNQNLFGGFTIGQGNGSAGTPGCYYPTGGGGAGGPGASSPATGGIGVSNSILGTSYYWGGGGGGSGYSGPGGNGGNGGGGGGPVGVTTGGSGLNPGANGNGGATVAQVNVPGSNGGANTGGGGSGGSHYNSNNYGGTGGSGVVIISYPNGSLTTTPSGSYQDRSSSTPGFTTYLFYGSGSILVGTSYPTVDVLAVAGGGGGGSAGASGGGGAGGMLASSAPIIGTGAYAVTVGGGGTQDTNGGGSSVLGLNAVGGGAGIAGAGRNGGSGGGSGRNNNVIVFALGTAGQGNNGGTAGYYSGQYPASGGGGAGSVGGSVSSGSPGTSGAGGTGLSSSISGSAVTYAAGGGGGGDYGCSRNLGPGAGGSGIGGNGGNSSNGNGASGAANTGSGGGGATQLSSCSASGTGGSGGSGIVIISYPTGTLTATGGTMTSSGGRTIHTFTSSGSFIVTALN